ncbi:TlyA family RNA methyltransferase [Leucobacter sp. GX24907]
MPCAERSVEVVWRGSAHRLDRVLVDLGLIRSRSQAAQRIAAGLVSVDGELVTKVGQRVPDGGRVELRSDGTGHYVGRAAQKLLAALDDFSIDPTGRRALDLGASTGGFTQVLLERGAQLVQAVDVGHGQMDDTLRQDPRVRLVEGCNARELNADSLARLTGEAERPELVVADLSFISLTLILPAIARTAAPDADAVLLIKPQFEVGRTGIQEGIVTDPSLRAEAIRTVLQSAVACGYRAAGLAISPITGAEGNIEFLVHLVPATAADPSEWEGRIEALCSGAEAPDPREPAPNGALRTGSPGVEYKDGEERNTHERETDPHRLAHCPR